MGACRGVDTDRVRAGQALAAATDDALASGDIPRTRALAERVLRSGTDGRSRGEVLSTLGVLEQYAGSVPAAADRLREAVPLVDGPVRVWILTELAMTRYRLNDHPGVDECAGHLRAFADTKDPRQEVLAAFVGGMAHVLHGR